MTKSTRSYETKVYRNLFKEIGKTDAEIKAKVDDAWQKLFKGNPDQERVYFETGTDMAYIKDIGSNDVRSEGMSYGMMISVQLGHQEEFDRLWRWADKYMRYADGPWKGYFAWQCDDQGKKMGRSPASDGEEYFAMALYFASGRWGNKGPINYRKEADSILDAMLHRPAGQTESTPMFDPATKLVVFVPGGSAATFTDPSYHLPAFYELWARWASKDRDYWKEATKASRAFLKKAAHPVTGLVSDYTSFEGKPMKAPWNANGIGDTFASDSHRYLGNIAMDYAWFGVDPWQREASNRLLSFFATQKPQYVSSYTVDGKPLVDYKATGLVAMNASAALVADWSIAEPFVRDLWDRTTPTGRWRYYDGLLYTFGLLHASGQYRIYEPKK